MRILLACLMLASGPAWAQTSAAPAPATQKAQAACAECGVVRSVRVVKKELRPEAGSETRPSGLVASVPLGGGKPQVGSSMQLGKDVVPTSQAWEIIVRFDDGRFRVVTVNEVPDLKEGDKVRIEGNGQIKRRTD